MKRAHEEYGKYKNRISNELTEVERHYLKEIEKIEELEVK